LKWSFQEETRNYTLVGDFQIGSFGSLGARATENTFFSNDCMYFKHRLWIDQVIFSNFDGLTMALIKLCEFLCKFEKKNLTIIVQIKTVIQLILVLYQAKNVSSLGTKWLHFINRSMLTVDTAIRLL